MKWLVGIRRDVNGAVLRQSFLILKKGERFYDTNNIFGIENNINGKKWNGVT